MILTTKLGCHRGFGQCWDKKGHDQDSGRENSNGECEDGK